MRYRILIVDDSGCGRPVLTGRLRQFRPTWKFIEAANTDEALREIAMEPVDIALVDFSRPGADGFELAALMRRARPSMPIAVASADLRSESAIIARRLDATFIPRPVSEDALAAFLAQAVLRLEIEAR